MKRIILIAACAILCACTTTQKLMVSGEPGTKIYSPQMEELGTISSSGSVTLELTSDAYYAYLLSKSPAKNEVVPFALNYMDNFYAGSKLCKYAGMSLAGAGMVTLVAMSLGAVWNADDSFLAATGFATLALEGIGLAMGIPGTVRNFQKAYEYNFKYLSSQRTNQDMIFAPLIGAAEPKPTAVTPAPKAQQPENSESAASHVKRKTERATKTFNDHGKRIEGTYVGNGTLTFNNKTVERYSNIKVIVSRITKDSVSVDVEESNGDKFFGSASTYAVQQNANNTYTLTNENISDAVIKIDANKKMVYIHPRVNIDGDIYSLNITAAKQ